MIRLDIFSDPICPWCFIGKSNLDRALEADASHPFTVEWHPFQLNPDMRAEGVNRLEYLAARFGGMERAEAMSRQVEETAAGYGVVIDFSKVERVPNTLDAHRLIHWAGLEGAQTPMVNAVLRAYWRESRDIGDQGVLADLAGEVGLDRAAMARLLASEADRDTITARDSHARERGISAVPTFVIADQYVVSGAQPPEMWRNVMAELKAQLP
ncbi:DsbA family oxidoreductase [Neogemmobacter tilapiae]|uniref:Polyketide biosynthesis protein n=1 Tax=Neogemmobacter tilapiae TaxID=875041 RepID=A0A918TH19_9RHOB|nr:DsbA family oxidoreductase [Gemmobacter tilapiae]GHC45745.1 polyketide biosynthesis protein [Gemmobacter tilapiae]